MPGTVPAPEEVADSDAGKVVVVEVADGVRDELQSARSSDTAITAVELASP